MLAIPLLNNEKPLERRLAVDDSPNEICVACKKPLTENRGYEHAGCLPKLKPQVLSGTPCNRNEKVKATLAVVSLVAMGVFIYASYSGMIPYSGM